MHYYLDYSHAQVEVADAANAAAFEVAVADIKTWAEDSGFLNIEGASISQQQDIVKQLLKQWLLYR